MRRAASWRHGRCRPVVSTELQVKSTRSDFYCEASSAPVVASAAAAALQQQLICALTRSQARDHQRCCDEAMMATAARCVEKSGTASWRDGRYRPAVSTELQVKSTRSDFYSEVSSAPVVASAAAAALQQRLICALTRSQGRDLQRCCDEAIMATAARNARSCR